MSSPATLERAASAYRAFTAYHAADRAARLAAFAATVGESDAARGRREFASRVWLMEPLALRAIVATLLHHAPALAADVALLTEYAEHATRYTAWECRETPQWGLRAAYPVLPQSCQRAVGEAVRAVLAGARP